MRLRVRGPSGPANRECWAEWGALEPVRRWGARSFVKRYRFREQEQRQPPYHYLLHRNINAVLEIVVNFLGKMDFKITYLPVDGYGMV